MPAVNPIRSPSYSFGSPVTSNLSLESSKLLHKTSPGLSNPSLLHLTLIDLDEINGVTTIGGYLTSIKTSPE